MFQYNQQRQFGGPGNPLDPDDPTSPYRPFDVQEQSQEPEPVDFMADNPAPPPVPARPPAGSPPPPISFDPMDRGPVQGPAIPQGPPPASQGPPPGPPPPMMSAPPPPSMSPPPSPPPISSGAGPGSPSNVQPPPSNGIGAPPPPPQIPQQFGPPPIAPNTYRVDQNGQPIIDPTTGKKVLMKGSQSIPLWRQIAGNMLGGAVPSLSPLAEKISAGDYPQQVRRYQQNLGGVKAGLDLNKEQWGMQRTAYEDSIKAADEKRKEAGEGRLEEQSKAQIGNMQEQRRNARAQTDLANQQRETELQKYYKPYQPVSGQPDPVGLREMNGTLYRPMTVQESGEVAGKLTEVEPDLGKRLQIKPTPDGRYFASEGSIAAAIKPPGNVSETELAQIATDPMQPPAKRAAAEAALKRLDQSKLASRPVANTTIGETNALDRETARFAKPHEKALADATSQFEKIKDASTMVNGNAVGQAAGIPKILTALVSGQGSGVRITKAELDSIGHARGIVGDIEGWINKVSGQGQLTALQQKQMTDLLNGIKDRVAQKQQIANDALDEINSAQNRDGAINADKKARKRLLDLENGKASTGNPVVDNLLKKYGGSGGSSGNGGGK